jgi:hypothetical protein
MPGRTHRKWSVTPVIHPRLTADFQAVLGQSSLSGTYIPCSVKTISGDLDPCVVLVEKSVAMDLAAFGPRGFGFWYQFDNRIMADLAEVASIQSSPYRIPIEIEEIMTKHGPTHAAGFLVRFVFSDEVSYWHASDESLWFATAPEGRSVKDIKNVIFPTAEECKGMWGRRTILKSPAFRWCVYRDAEHLSRRDIREASRI